LINIKKSIKKSKYELLPLKVNFCCVAPLPGDIKGFSNCATQTKVAISQ
jgi:hypothetical protein